METQRILYLSYKADADLICLWTQLGGRKFAKAVKEALRMTVRAGYRSKFIEKLDIDPNYEFTLQRKAVRVSISLNAEDDDDIRALLCAATKGRSQVMKHALRYAVGPYFTIGYYLDGNEKLCSEYRNKGLFFVQCFSSKKSRPHTAPSSSIPGGGKTKDVPIPSAQEEIPDIPMPVSDTGPDFEDDDILSMLENMM